MCDNIQFIGLSEFIRLHKFNGKLERLLSIITVMGMLIPTTYRKNNETIEDIDCFVKQQIPYVQHILFYAMVYQHKFNPQLIQNIDFCKQVVVIVKNLNLCTPHVLE